MRTVALMRVGVEEQLQVEVELEGGSSAGDSSAPDPAADSELPNSGCWSLSDLVSSSLIHSFIFTRRANPALTGSHDTVT